MRGSLRVAVAIGAAAAVLSLLFTLGLALDLLPEIELPAAVHAALAVLSGFVGTVLLSLNWWITVGALSLAFALAHRRAAGAGRDASR